ncbi:MAG TPA: aminomethyl-transferring glycine dehydrogenase [Cyclobacteriaceae bacterium]|nr:aminomethyl-transferring glycine dehydrogenase [Cyclobacteriaceae bacterium]
MKYNLNRGGNFENRHIGPRESDLEKMLETIGVSSLDELIDQTIPPGIRLKKELNLPAAENEYDFLTHFRKIAGKNKIYRSFIGQGYYNTITPSVILRNIFENPGWYTAYTPYQAEIAQGRLEALINFQTAVADLTGMAIANASLLDEGTAAAEAMMMLHSLRKPDKKQASSYLVDSGVFAQTTDVLKTRALPAGIQIEVTDVMDADLSRKEIFGILIQYPSGDGNIRDYTGIVKKAKEHGLYVAFTADLLSLALINPPGEMGADVVTGSSQRFGIPLSYGGPHAAYFATKEEFKRQIPGRIIGVSIDARGQKAYRMALQTREQHIRREKATSNICTSQVLLAVMAGMYCVYHGPSGLKEIAARIHALALLFSSILEKIGYRQSNKIFFDTLNITVSPGEMKEIRSLAEQKGYNLRYDGDSQIGLSFDETSSAEDIENLSAIFATVRRIELKSFQPFILGGIAVDCIPVSLARKSGFFSHPVFHIYQSEHEMLRYIKYLENKDLSLVHSMISLGSCTMKLNATTEMIPLSWGEIMNIHPFAPADQAMGYQDIFKELESWLNEITGFSATSFQPNSGAQGEFTGLMVIRAYLRSINQGSRNVTLIPSSAHGTNPASAVMAGMDVVIVNCDENGNIDLKDLNAKAEMHKEKLAALMVTYPSTHGVFEENIREICKVIHQYGGQVYMDGANMNAQVGLTNPARIGADLCHINLHKTFCIPHGGGGPGAGPLSVAVHLKPFLPGNAIIRTGGEQAIHAVSSAPWGSAAILAISYAFIKLMGAKGLTNATRMAILNANYLAARLQQHYKILYSGINGRVAHEFIVDCRDFKKVKIEVEDIAKRLMDYGFHAPTISFPVHGTMMIEPTESESLEELGRFCDALIEIREEIREIENGKASETDNVLKNSPHTLDECVSDNWKHPYSREKAVFPLPFVRNRKFWPSVARIDNAYGDRNLFCTCIPVENYSESALEPMVR